MWIPALLVGGLLLFAAGSGKKRTSKPASVPARAPTEEEAEGIIFCQDQGGNVAPMETADGETYFVCQFPDGRVAEVIEFMGGVEPVCPVNMAYDPETEACVEVGVPDDGPTTEEILNDPNFVLCTTRFLDAWRPYADESYNLDPAVAANIRAILASVIEAEEGNAHAEDLILIGMGHVSPECDFVVYEPYFDRIVTEVIEPDLGKVEEVYISVVEIVDEAMGGFAGRHGRHGPTVRQQHVRAIDQIRHGYAGGEDLVYRCTESDNQSCGSGWCFTTTDPDSPTVCASKTKARKVLRKKRHRTAKVRRLADRLRMPASYAVPATHRRQGYAGGCKSRRGHCGVRRRG